MVNVIDILEMAFRFIERPQSMMIIFNFQV